MLFGIVFPAVATAIRVVQSGAPFGLSSIAAAQRADPLMWIIDTAPLFLGLLAALAGARQDAATERTRLLVERERELTATRRTLEQRVQDRTRDLEQRNEELQSAVFLTRRLSAIGDSTGLVSTTTDALATMHTGYDVDLYLVDPGGRVATLAASSPQGKARWWSVERTVRVGDETLVGRSAGGSRSIVEPTAAGDADASSRPPRFALPLTVRGRVLGVLLMQPGPSAMSDRQPRLEILQLLADQVAAAIDSTRMIGETRAALAQLEQLSGDSGQSAWRSFLRERQVAFRYTPAGVVEVPPGSGGGDGDSLRTTLMVRGQQIGSLSMRRAPGTAWTDAERDLAQKVAAQVALALENARLLEDTRRRVSREQQMSEISARFSRALDLDTLLQTAVRELAALPGVADASILLQPEERTTGGAAA
jgi:K+-sensing histidine kinase KdpD